MLRVLSRPAVRASAVPLLAALLLAGCGDDGEDRAAAPATTAPPAATTTPPAAEEQAPPAEEQAPPAETTEEQAPAEQQEPEAEKPAEAGAAGTDSSLDGAAEAAAASLRAQLEGDYPTVKRLVTERCGKQVTKASVEQMAAAFEMMTKKADQKRLKSILEKLSTPDGWVVTASGKGVAKVSAPKEMGFSDYYYVREDGAWRDDTCARQPGASTTQGA